MANERRRSNAPLRASKRFIALLAEKYPKQARVAYSLRGDDKTAYVKMLMNPKQENEIFGFAAALTGLIAEQEGIQVLLLRDDDAAPPEINNDEQLKTLQQNLSHQVEILRKLRAFNDAEAKRQRNEYLSRLRASYDVMTRFLLANQ